MKTIRVGIVFLFGTLLSGMPSASAQSFLPELRNIFGPDNRVAAPLEKEPYRRVIRLIIHKNGRRVRCTGSLIGPSLVLTAQHCIDNVLDFSTDKLTGRVQAEAQASDRFVEVASEVTEVVARGYWTTRRQPRSEDWAILRTAEDLSTRYGSFEVRDEIQGFADLETGDLLIPGYGRSRFAGGMTMTVGDPCSARNLFTNGLFYHDCASTRGSSGAPVLRCSPKGDGKDCYVVGVNVAEFRGGGEDSLVVDHYSDRYANVAVNAWQFVDAVKDALVEQH